MKLLSILILMAAAPIASAQTLTLSASQCVDMAIAASQDIKCAENSAVKSHLDSRDAATSYLPRIEGSATGLYMGKDIDMGTSTMVMHGAYVAGLQLVQPIYTGGKITAGRRLAAIGREVSAQQLRLNRADVAAQASDAYWTLVAVSSKKDLMHHYIAMMDTLLGQTSVAVEAGLATSSQLLRIEAKRSEILYQKQKVESGLRLCRMALCNLIGVDPETPVATTDTLPACALPADLDTDISDRPELQLLQLQVKAGERQVDMARSDYLPTVGMSVAYNFYGNMKMKGYIDAGGGNYVPYSQNINGSQAIGLLSVKIPIFSWGEGCRKVKKARLDVDNSRLQLDKNRRLLSLQAQQTLTNLTDGMELVKSAKTAFDQAVENLRVMQNRYDEGMSPLTDLLDAQSQWHQSRAALIEASTQHQINITAWRKATGKL